MNITLALGALALLIAVNGCLSLAEMALVASHKLRLKHRAQAGDRRAAAAWRLAERPDQVFSTIQVGITLVGILAGVFSGATLTGPLAAALARVPGLAPYAGALGATLVVVGVTYLTIVFGELVPKRLAYAHPETLAGLTAPAMLLFMRLCAPLVRFLSLSTRVVVRLLGLSLPAGPTVTEEDLRGLIGEGARLGFLEAAEKEMFERIIRLSDRPVSALMTHRARVVWLDADAPWPEVLATIAATPYTRYPLARGELGEILGVVRGRDLLLEAAAGRTPRLEDHLIRPLFVPESMPALKLVERIKAHEGMHLAFVVDEFGDVQGLVTLSDILEAIVGDIPLPGTQPEPAAIRREDGSWLFDGLLPMDEVRAVLGLPALAPAEAPFQTLAGFILGRLGRIPVSGEFCEENGWRFEIADMDGKRIDKVLVSPRPQEDEPDAS